MPSLQIGQYSCLDLHFLPVIHLIELAPFVLALLHHTEWARIAIEIRPILFKDGNIAAQFSPNVRCYRHLGNII